MSGDSYYDGCFRKIVGAIVLLFVGFCILAKCSSRQFYKQQAEIDADRAVRKAQSDAIKAKVAAEEAERLRQMKRDSAANAAAGKSGRIINQSQRDWSNVDITGILDDVDVEDLYDYYDFEPPEGY